MRKFLCFFGSVFTLLIALILAVVVAVFDVLGALSRSIVTGVSSLGFKLCEISDKWIDEFDVDE